MQRKKTENDLLGKIKHGKFEEIENEIKPEIFKDCKSNSLLMGMKVRSYLVVPEDEGA